MEIDKGKNSKLIKYVFNFDIKLTEKEKIKLMFHSFVNLINILIGLLFYLV
jgi:hypothetical protein